MRVSIKATNLERTPAIDEYLDKKLTSLERLLDARDSSIHAQAEIEKTTRHHKQGNIFRAEINLHIAGKQFRAEATAQTLYNALDEVHTRMRKELRRHKDKRVSLLRRGGSVIKKYFKGNNS